VAVQGCVLPSRGQGRASGARRDDSRRPLTAVSNGRLLGASGLEEIRSPRAADPAQRWRTFHWSFDYPISTFSVALCIGPFVETSREVELPEVSGLVPFQYWVLPEKQEAAAVQFAEVPEILAVYTRARALPFPREVGWPR
jgi:aminopeptidase N